MAIEINKNDDKQVTIENQPQAKRALFPNLGDSLPYDELKEIVEEWLEDNPEYTTTVEDGSLLPVKLDSENEATANYVLAFDGTKFVWVDLQANFADEFDSSHVGGYSAGNYVMHEGQMYVFTADHTGNWDASDVQAVSVELIASNLQGEIDSLKQDIQELDGYFETENHKSANLLDYDALETGCYYWTNGKNTNASYNSTGLIPVTPGQTIFGSRGAASVSVGRALWGFRFVVAYGSDGTTVVDSASNTNANDGYTVPNGASYIRIGSANYLNQTTDLYTMIQSTATLFDFVPYFDPYTTTWLKALYNNDPHIISVIQEQKDKKAIFTASAASLAANTNLICCNYCDNKKNEYIELTAGFDTFDELMVAHGKGSFGGGYIKITNSKLQVYDYDDTLLEEFDHGLTLSDFINVIIYTKNDSTVRSSITIMSSGGDYTASTTRLYSCHGSVLCRASFALTDVKMDYIVNDAKEDVWVFGDSYISLGDNNRWATQMVSGGHKNVLLSGFGGATAQVEIDSFRNLIAVAKPQIVVWCLGMNNGDNEAINASWKICVDEVIQKCVDNSVIPVLATIPNVPSIDNTYKNAYIKSLGYRYVDFAKAVNAESAGATWYTGMLSQDNTHPTALGAKALMRQFLLDVPEVLYAEE